MISFAYKNINIQKEFYKKGLEYEKNNLLIPAIDAYERVILAYVPLSPYNRKALDKILYICERLDSYDKLYCYETVKASLFQIQSFYQPFENIKDEVFEKIVNLRTELYAADLQLSEDEKSKIRPIMEEIAKKEFNPDKFWAFIAPVSLISWISFVIAGIWYRKLYFYLGFILSFVIWVVSLYMA